MTKGDATILTKQKITLIKVFNNLKKSNPEYAVSKLFSLEKDYCYIHKLLKKHFIYKKTDLIKLYRRRIHFKLGNSKIAFKRIQMKNIKNSQYNYFVLGYNYVAHDVTQYDVDNLVDDLIRYVEYNI